LPHKIMIDADCGVTDALAIGLALVDPELDVLAVTATGGRVSVQQAARNLITLIEAIDPPKWPRIGVADTPDTEYEQVRFREQMGDELLVCRRLHGEAGFGDWPVGDAELHHPRSAAKLLGETTREHPGEVTLVTLAPLSTVAHAQELDPEFSARLKGLVSFAGTMLSGGDVSPVAEFNVAFNPEAARHVLRHPATKTLVPLDIGRKAVLTFDSVARLKLDDGEPRSRLLQSLLNFSLRAHHEALGMEGMWLMDIAAIAAVSQPQLFTRQSIGVDVETAGRLTRGMTVFDRRVRPSWRPNIDVLTDANAQGLLDYMAAVLGPQRLMG
jgi:inosine-uridine nucleoside N-ribohydrolase